MIENQELQLICEQLSEEGLAYCDSYFTVTNNPDNIAPKDNIQYRFPLGKEYEPGMLCLIATRFTLDPTVFYVCKIFANIDEAHAFVKDNRMSRVNFNIK